MLKPPRDPRLAWEDFERMFKSQEHLRLLLAALPPGSTLEDARRFHRRMAQMSRRPCSFLDEELGIKRD